MSMSLIDTGAYDVAEWLPRSLSRATEWELEHQVVPGTVDAYARLFAGSWDETDIIVTRPGEPLGFDDLLWGADKDTDRGVRLGDTGKRDSLGRDLVNHHRSLV